MPEPMPDLESQLIDERLRRLFVYWRGLRDTRRMPARRELDPIAFRYLLGHICLIDVHRDPLRFRVRLHGTAMCARIHMDLTGKFLDEMPESDLKTYLVERCCGLVETAEPLRIEHEREFEGRIHRYEALWLPLAEDGTTVTMLMLAMIYPPERPFRFTDLTRATAPV
jgi:hypothetical protein